MHIAFVYGTLKRGFPNHEEWMKPFKYITNGTTCDKFPLIVGGIYHSPILLNEQGNGHIIKGELFGVDDEGLKTLDAIESVGKPNGYIRIEVEITDGKSNMNAWVYVKDRTSVDIIHNELTGKYLLDARYIPAAQR